jgi:peroxiredoxin Q/BCP
MKIKEGIQAPDFTLEGHDGKTYTLSDLKGKKVFLYFYPKDNTPGCTCEAETLRDAIAEFKKAKAHVFGISADSLASHKKFAEKLNLPFPLLSDSEKKVVTLYGVWGKKKMMGREYMGIKRMSFLIGADGVVLRVYEDVKPKEHASEVVLDLKKK